MKSNKHNLHLQLHSSSLLLLSSHTANSACHSPCTHLPPSHSSNSSWVSALTLPSTFYANNNKNDFFKSKNVFKMTSSPKCISPIWHTMSKLANYFIAQIEKFLMKTSPSSLHSHVSTFLANLQPHLSQGQCAQSTLTPPKCAILNILPNNCHYIVFPAD